MAGQEPAFEIVRAKIARQWFVLEHGKVACSLTEFQEPDQKHKSFRLKSEHGDWLIRTTKRWSKYQLFRQGEDDYSAELRANHSPSLFAEEPDQVSDLYIDLVSYRASEMGHRWRVKLKEEPILDYGKPWRDADSSRRVCYQIYVTQELNPRHRDLLLLAPLFWSGMEMHSPSTVH